MADRRRGRGRPRKLTAEVEEKLLQATEAGSPVELAAEFAGIGRSTFTFWMQWGHDEFEDRQNGLTPDHSKDEYVRLFRAITEARAKAAVSGVVLVNRVARGGAVTEETVKKYKDPTTGAVVEEKTVKRTAPDWRAAAWMLEKQHRNFFGKDVQQLEVTGAGGGAVQVEHTVVTEDLGARIRENLALALAPLALPAGGNDGIGTDVVDGEVVEAAT
jgi:hypothetical protein